MLILQNKIGHSYLRQCYGRHHDLVSSYGISVSQMTTDMFRLSSSQADSFLIHELSRFCNKSNTTGATGGAGTAYPSGAPKLTPGF